MISLQHNCEVKIDNSKETSKWFLQSYNICSEGEWPHSEPDSEGLLHSLWWVEQNQPVPLVEVQGWDRNYKERALHSVGAESGKKADISSPQQDSGPGAKMPHALPPEGTKDREELLVLLLAVYPEAAEDVWPTEPWQQTTVGSS